RPSEQRFGQAAGYPRIERRDREGGVEIVEPARRSFAVYATVGAGPEPRPSCGRTERQRVDVDVDPGRTAPDVLDHRTAGADVPIPIQMHAADVDGRRPLRIGGERQVVIALR